MNIRSAMRSRLLGIVFSPGVQQLQRWLHEQRRRLTGRKHVISVFLQLDDPYSYILSRYLPTLAAHYDIALEVRLSEAVSEGFQPAANLLAEYAIVDCRRLAEELAIPFLDKAALPPTEYRAAMTDALATTIGRKDFNDAIYEALESYWRGDTAAAEVLGGRNSDGVSGQAFTSKSQQRLQALGHYSSAMLYYAGEWYWGVDRLSHLLNRLETLGVQNDEMLPPALAKLLQARQPALPARPPGAASKLPPIELFFSFRSPYSYLAIQRCFDIAEAFGTQVVLRPVLPMLTRGLPVPNAKLRYIAFDAVREARRLDIPFGKFADPLGTGVERCMAVLQYAEAENKGREFVVAACTAIWSERIDVATDSGMRKVARRCGLFWPDVVNAMQADDWRDAVERNRELLEAAGCWGVPTVRMGEYVGWGQDRDWLLIRHLEEACASADGILV